jgi:hypothetical protein
MPDAERLFIERSAWNWFCTWSGGFITDGLSNSPAQINTVFNHQYVITLDELDDVDAIIADLDEKRDALDNEVVLGTEDWVAVNVGYENPIQHNTLVLSSKKGQNILSAIIYNVQGKEEFSRDNTNLKETLDFDFTQKAAGVYIVKIHTASGPKIIRVIKQ